MIKLTLEVTPKQMLDIANLLNTSPESISEPSRHEQLLVDPLPPEEVKTPSEQSIGQPKANSVKSPGKRTTMPSFGRTKEQVDAYVESEETRLEIADEEALLKTERKAQRETDKAKKEAEVAEIKEEVVDTSQPLPTKPWTL